MQVERLGLAFPRLNIRQIERAARFKLTALLVKQYKEIRLINTYRKIRSVPGDLLGWYSHIDLEDEREYHPHAFIPVVQGKTAGIAIVRKRYFPPTI